MSLKRQIERAQLMEQKNRSPKSLTEIKVSTPTRPLKTTMVPTKEIVVKDDGALSEKEEAILPFLDAVPKGERLETARAILRTLNTIKVRDYRNRKKAKPNAL